MRRYGKPLSRPAPSRAAPSPAVADRCSGSFRSRARPSWRSVAATSRSERPVKPRGRQGKAEAARRPAADRVAPRSKGEAPGPLPGRALRRGRRRRAEEEGGRRPAPQGRRAPSWRWARTGRAAPSAAGPRSRLGRLHAAHDGLPPQRPAPLPGSLPPHWCQSPRFRPENRRRIPASGRQPIHSVFTAETACRALRKCAGEPQSS